MESSQLKRRQLLQYTLLGTIGVCLFQPRKAAAVGLMPLAANDVTAKGLDYHATADTVDRNDYPEYEPSQRCASCVHLVVSDDQHGCKLMPGKAINLDGWCKVWTPQS